MKKIWITIIGVVVAATSLMAQAEEEAGKPENRRPHRGEMRDMTPEERAQAATDRLKEALKLTDEQAGEVYNIHLKYAQERKAAFDAEKGEREAMRSRMQQIGEQQKEELKTVLTEEQMTQLQAQLDQRKDERAGRQSGRPGRGHRRQGKY